MRTQILTALALLGLAPAGWLAASAFRAELRTFRPRRGPVPLPEPPVAGLVAVTIPVPEGLPVEGWWVPSRNGAAVLFAHGSEADRGQLVPEARLLASRGYGGLLLDLPGHGESPGEVHWSGEARAALRAGLRFVAAQPGVDPRRVAGYGFSMGAHAFAQLSAEDLPLAALVLAGPPTDGDELTRNEFEAWGPLTQLPGLLADRCAGFEAAPTPISIVAMSRRPILLVWGANDRVVPPRMPEALVGSGPGPRVALRLPASGHGGYLDTDAELFTRGLLGFLERWIGA